MSNREELIAGLRALADFYENNPTMPTDGFASVLVSCCTITGNDDAAAAALVEHAAELLGTPVKRHNGHTSTERKFHGVSIRPYATTRESMARYRAEQSYAGAVEPEPQDGHVYLCCGKTGRISPHKSWCTGGAS